MRAFRLVAASLAGVVLAGVVVPTAVAAGVNQEPTTAQKLRLPGPQGGYATGQSTFRLVDDRRTDPWVPTRT